jgi:secreted trypsin-like serine protease
VIDLPETIMSKAAPSKRPATEKALTPIVAKAVRDAEKAAANDDRAFFERLRANLGPQVLAPADGGGRALGAGARPSQDGPRLGDDPRYVANLRALARQSGNARIIGGTAVPASEFLDCVAVGSDTQWGCTGTLVAPDVVLTAAHCEMLHTRVFVGRDVNKPGRVFKVKKFVRHAKFDRRFNNDLMLLILEKKVTGVKPRAMAPAALIDKATMARLVGFGSTRLDGLGMLGAKLQTDVPIVSAGCDGKLNGRADSQVYGCHLNREIVAGKPLLLHDSCKGDSGGPLFIKDAKGQWLLAGVTSRGTDLATTMCGDGGLYVRVDAYQKWIASNLKA